MVIRNIIKIDKEKCNGCGLCIPSCAEGAIEIIDGKAKLVKDMYCDGLGACLGNCPQDALTIIQREAEDFDEKAAEEYVKRKQIAIKDTEKNLKPNSCPSIKPIHFNIDNESSIKINNNVSRLSTWPIQLKLVPPHASFLKGDLLIAADCVPFAYPNFHEEMLKDKILLVGCPKLDDLKLYKNKLTEIFRTANISSITIVNMEVPCCFGLNHIVQEAITNSEKNIPINQVTISIKGEKLSN